jgi:hypothetical protein
MARQPETFGGIAVTQPVSASISDYYCVIEVSGAPEVLPKPDWTCVQLDFPARHLNNWLEEGMRPKRGGCFEKWR